MPAGSTADGVPAVTVESGVQFSDLYPAAQAQPYPGDPLGRSAIVMGGGCDSVGVGGCWLGGCYNVFTKKFGDGAVNLLAARVVLANGSIVTASETSHADLFWTLRGGGGGNTGVVTQFTARTHPAPMYMTSSGFSGRAKDLPGFKLLLKRVLRGLADSNDWPLEQQCVSGTPHWNVSGLSSGLGCRHYEGSPDAIRALYQPMLDWCAQPAQAQQGIECKAWAGLMWNQTDYDPRAHSWGNASWLPRVFIGNEPWLSYHPDREISTSLVGSVSKYLPMAACVDGAAADAMVAGIIKVEGALARLSSTTDGVNTLGVGAPTGDKSQSGMPPEIVARFRKTALNPVLLQAPAFWLIMLNVPSLPQLPPSSKVLGALWPRLQNYSIRSKRDALWPACEAGAAGDEASARQCMEGWSARVPRLKKQVQEVRQLMWETFPNELPNGTAFSGSYWNEADYEDPSFQQSHWGSSYPRLLALKKQLDPQGLFYGHHSVGSELWDETGNCRVHAA